MHTSPVCGKSGGGEGGMGGGKGGKGGGGDGGGGEGGARDDDEDARVYSTVGLDSRTTSKTSDNTVVFDELKSSAAASTASLEGLVTVTFTITLAARTLMVTSDTLNPYLSAKRSLNASASKSDTSPSIKNEAYMMFALGGDRSCSMLDTG